MPGEPPEPPMRNTGLTLKNRSDHVDPHKPHYNNDSNNGPSIIKIPPPHSLHPVDLASDNYPYVQLTSLNHDYLYPVIDEHQQQCINNKIKRTNSTGSLKKPDIIESQVN